MVRKGSRVQVPTTAPRYLGRYQSGQLGQTVNLLTYVFVGSNPTRPTRIKLPENLTTARQNVQGENTA